MPSEKNFQKFFLILSVVFVALGNGLNSTITTEQDINVQVNNLLSKLEKLESEHLRTRRDKWDVMSEKDKQKIMDTNLYISSGLEESLKTLVRDTGIKIAALGEPAVPLLMQKLRSFTPEIHYQRLCITRSLREFGELAVPYLIDALQGPGIQDKAADARYRNVIISTLGDMKDTRAVAPLLVLLHQSRTSNIRHTTAIAIALGRIGDKRAVEPIISELDTCIARATETGNWDEDNGSVMISCARGLGLLNDIRAIPVLRKALKAGPQRTKAGEQYLVAEEAARALRSLVAIQRKSERGERKWTGELGGEVIAPDGKLLADAQVRGYRMRHNHYFFGIGPQVAEPLETVRTDNMGQFFFSTSPTSLEVTHMDWPGWKAQIRVTDRKFKVLTMRKVYALDSLVLNEDNEPIDDVQITLEMHTGAVAAALGWSEFVTLRSVPSREDGSFSLEGLVPGNRYRLAVYARGYVRYVTDLFDFLGSDIAKLNRIKLARGTTLNFTVLSPEGNTLPNTLVQVSDSNALDWFCETAHTDSAGKVTISDLPAGKIWVCVHPEGFLDRKWHRSYYCEPDRDGNVTVMMKSAERTTERTTLKANDKTGVDPTRNVRGATSSSETIIEPPVLERDLVTLMGDMPDEAQRVLKEYSRCVEQGDPKSLEELLCFNDERDRELFMAFSSSGGKIYIRPELFPCGKPVEQKRAAEDSWMIVVGDDHLLELWKVEGKWKVLCPVPGKTRMAGAKLTRAETRRYLLAEEIRQVQSESNIQLQRRRQRYLAVLDLSRRHQIKHLAYYFSGIPANDPAVLSKMSTGQFREAAILKLDAPDGVRYRVDPEQKALLEGKPVFVVFSIENVTSGILRLKYRLAVEIVDFSNAITARGALVFPRGERTTDRMKSAFSGKLVHPLKEREVEIAPGETFTMRIDLLEYYDLPAARYTISSRIDIENAEQGYWRGHALSDTTPFEIIPLSAGGPPDPNTAMIAGKVTDTATGKGVAGIPVVLGGRAVTTTLPDGTYRATNVAPGPTSVGARDRDWYIVPHRKGAVSAYYGRLQYEKVNLEAGKETHLDIQVTKGGKIKGTVWDVSGKAVLRTIIWIVNQQEDNIVAAETGEFGDYTSYGLAPDIPLELLVWTSDGRGSARRTVTLKAGEVHEVNLTLDPENEHRIEGKVSDSSGRGVPNVPMRCWWRERNRRCQRSLHTDDNGNFCFSGLDRSPEYEVCAYGESAAFDTVKKSVRIPTNERTARLFFHLQKREEEPAATATPKRAYELSISEILLRLCTEVEKAYADVGLSKEQARSFFLRQQSQSSMEAHQKAWPSIRAARQKAIKLMAGFGPDAVPALLRAQDDSIGGANHGDIFVDAIAMIGKLAVPSLIDHFTNVHSVRRRAVHSLTRIKDPRTTDVLLEAIEDPDLSFAMAVAEALAALREIQAVTPMFKLWNSPEVTRSQKALLATYLAQIGNKRAVDPIVQELEKWSSHMKATGKWYYSAWTVQRYVWALQKLGDARALPALESAAATAKTAPPQLGKKGEPLLDANRALIREISKAIRSVAGLRGRVISPEGLPLADAKIRINRRKSEVLSSDQNGQFLYRDRGRTYYFLEATHADWPNYMAFVSPSPDTEQDHVLLVLQEVRTFDGKVLHQGSAVPVADAEVTLEIYVGGHTASGFLRLDKITTQDDGSFRIKNIVPGNRYRLVVYAKDHSRVITDWFSIKDGIFLDSHNLVFSQNVRVYAGRDVTFQVMDPDGNPLANAQVWVGGKDWPYGQGRTDGSGQVTIADIPRPRQLLEQTKEKQIHVHVSTGGQWHQEEHWYEPDEHNNVTIRLLDVKTKIQDQEGVQVNGIMNRLCAAIERAYADLGLSKEDVQGLLASQAPPQKLMGKWKAYQETWPAIKKAREAAIEEMASLGPGAVPALLEATDKSDDRRGGDIFVSVIARIGKPGVPAVINGLLHDKAEVRIRASVSLGKIHDRRAVEPLIHALNDPDGRIVRAAVRSLGFLKDQRAVEPILNLWTKDIIRKSDLAWALGSIGNRRVTRLIMDALEECVSKAEETGDWDMNSWDMRAYAGALGQIGDSHAMPILKNLLFAGPQRTKSPTPIYLVAEAAARALRSLGVAVTGDREKGGYKVIEVAPQEVVQKQGENKGARPNAMFPRGQVGKQDRSIRQEAVEIRTNTENRHRLDEYAYREDRRDDGTHVLGTIRNAVRWETDKSPYVMDENVFVADDGSLVIEPGVEVKVVRLTEDTSSIGAYICLRILGTLRAQGTPNAMIRFTSASDKPNKYREWQGIMLNDGSSVSVLKWVLVEDAIFGIDAYSPVLIAHCIFRECHTGIYLERDFVGDVLHNVSAFNAYSGIRCKGTRAEATIINNICYENGDGIRGWWDAVAFSDYNLYWSSKRNASAHYYSGMEPGAHDITANPCFVNPHENDFRLASHSPAKEMGYGNADIGLDISHWSEEAGEQENANWIANGARSLWHQGLELEQRSRPSVEEQYRQALKLSVAPELRDKIFCSLTRVLISKAEYSFARQILHTVLSESEYRHIRDLARRHLADAWALDGKPDEALQVVMAVEWPQSQVWAKPLTAKYRSITGNHEDALRSLADLKSNEPYRYVKTLSDMVSDLLSTGQVDAAVHVMKGFDDCPLAEEVPVAYLKIAKAARDQQRSDLAVDLLNKSCRLDPFSKKAPELLTLLAEILDRDMKRREAANAVLARLCVDYFPFNRYVMEASKRIHVEVPSPDKMILLDASLGGSTIFDRGPTGGNNFGQYEVMRILTEAGYTVHTNDRRQSIAGIRNVLTPDIINRYGLIIFNGRYGGRADPPIPREVIDTLVEYVGDGGSLLVVASGKRLGSGKAAQYYNPLIERFGLHFIENVDLPRELVTATNHPAMNGLENCVHTFGVPVRVNDGDILGYINEQPVMALARYGRGKVIAAGLGSGFMGNTLGTRESYGIEQARMNRELLVRLAPYLLSPGERMQDRTGRN